MPMRGSIQTAPKQRGQGVSEDVEIGAAQIVVVVPVPMMGAMVESVSLRPFLVRFGAVSGRIAPGIEDKHRYAVHDKAKGGDGDCPVEGDRNQRHQARNAFDGHVQSETDQQQCARVAAKRIDLAGAECEAGIAGAAAAVDIRKNCQAEGGRMGGHVEAVREQRHRSEGKAGHDLDPHGHGGQKGDDQGAPFSPLRPIETERVAVLPGREIRLMHWCNPSCRSLCQVPHADNCDEPTWPHIAENETEDVRTDAVCHRASPTARIRSASSRVGPASS